MHRNKSVDVHQFAMIPNQEVPRSSFRIQSTHKTTFDSGYLIPMYVDEVLPGDTFNLQATMFARLATPLFPFMDNLFLDTFWFFVPNRLVHTNWVKLMGEQDNPTDSISFLVPSMSSPLGGYAPLSIFDYFGLPTVGQVTAGNAATHISTPLRAYNLIWNSWFRDENLQTSAVVNKGDGFDIYTDYALLRRGKRPDYFTTCLPNPQKGSTPVSVPLGGTAPIFRTANAPTALSAHALGSNAAVAAGTVQTIAGGGIQSATAPFTIDPHGSLYADLSAATSVTINQLRQSFAIQNLLEKDARGGTRYTEMVREHFKVTSPDARLQRPEYLGGGSTPIAVNPVAQTSATATAGTETPQGNLSAYGQVVSRNGFTQSFTEHGLIIGLCSVRADITYQQGLRKMWVRQTRYDYYFPVFANLGEQTVLNREIYVTGTASDANVFGYQERWAEYRYHPSRITGFMKSTTTGTIDQWHLAQRFTTTPTLNSQFIQDTPPLQRVLAVGPEALGQEFLCDMFFDVKAARPLPMYSPPGLGKFL